MTKSLIANLYDLGAALRGLGLSGTLAILASLWLAPTMATAAGAFGVPRSWRPWLSLGAATVAAGVLLTTNQAGALWSLPLGWTLLVLATIDAATLRLPDLFTIPLTVAGLLEAWPSGEPLTNRWAGYAAAVTICVVTDALYRSWRGRPGLGYGDVKLLGAAGAWLGLSALGPMLLLGSGLGFGWLAARVLRGGVGRLREPLPFGAPLCAAFWVLWLSR